MSARRRARWRAPLLAINAVLATATVAVAQPSSPAEPARGASEAPALDLGLAFAIPRDDGGARVVDDAWIRARIAEANRLWAPARVRFRWTLDEDLPPGQREAHSREDRDALAPLVVRGHVRVAVVSALEDVDEPGRMRMGVCWTARKDGRRFVLLSTASFPGVLAHELGHFLGNGHVAVPDNLMSYTRTGAEVFVDDGQTARARGTALRLLAAGTLVDVGPARRVP
jgi:hypothetical protein